MKEPARRYESSRDLFRDLASIRDHLSEISTEVQKAGAIPAAALKSTRRWMVPVAFALGAAIALPIMAVVGSRPALQDLSSYRFTPFSFEAGGQGGAVWSPDGKAVAYAARQKTSEPYQLYVRYLDAPTGVQVTHLTTTAFPVAWSSDSRRVFFLVEDPKPALWSVATVGGEPELVMSLPENIYGGKAWLGIGPPDSGAVAISRDNRSVAVLTRPGLQVAISSPPGTPFKLYAPAPFETHLVSTGHGSASRRMTSSSLSW